MDYMDRELHEECGVFGIIGHQDASQICYYGLHSLQHRGQEAAGICCENNGKMIFPGMSLLIILQKIQLLIFFSSIALF